MSVSGGLSARFRTSSSRKRGSNSSPDSLSHGFLLFARLFRQPPTKELLEVLGGAGWASQAEAIAIEYARLFAVPGEQVVHPYESAYCDVLSIDTSTACSAYFESEPSMAGLNGFIAGPSSVAVREFYRRAGFELNPETAHELPDHLAIELEFMGRLLAHGDRVEAEAFFTEHLGRWVFRVLEEIAQKTGSGFYRAAADGLSAFLHQERLHSQVEV